jgi:hypothetical protein
MLGEKGEMKRAIASAFPVVVGFGLCAFFFSCKHDDYADVLLPNNIPEVLHLVSR